jgi:drug/metabolite transporter (DMT)-like permease
MALALAILSALSWGVAAVAGGLLARRIGALPALGWVMVLSLIAALPLALASGPPGDLDGTTLIGVVIVTAGGLGGLGLIYAALRLGSVSVVAPVSATYGGVAALLAVVAGETIGAVATLALGVAVVGAVLAARGETVTPGLVLANQSRAVLLAAGTALLWGMQLFVGGRLGEEVGASWLVLAMRVTGVVCIAVPLLLRGRLPLRRDVLLLGLVAGVGEVGGFTLYLLAAADGVAVASVISSQYAAIAALIGITVLRERLRRLQLIGVGLILAAVTMLAIA